MAIGISPNSLNVIIDMQCINVLVVCSKMRTNYFFCRLLCVNTGVCSIIVYYSKYFFLQTVTPRKLPVSRGEKRGVQRQLGNRYSRRSKDEPVNGDTTDDDRDDSTFRQISKEQGMGCSQQSTVFRTRSSVTPDYIQMNAHSEITPVVIVGNQSEILPTLHLFCSLQQIF